MYPLYVVHCLSAEGSRLFQVAYVDAMGWSKAKSDYIAYTPPSQGSLYAKNATFIWGFSGVNAKVPTGTWAIEG